GKKLGVIAGPTFMDAAGARPLEVTNYITIRVQHADCRDGDGRQFPLPTCLTKQCFRPKHRWRIMLLITDDRPRDTRTIGFLIHHDVSPSHTLGRMSRSAAFHTRALRK